MRLIDADVVIDKLCRIAVRDDLYGIGVQDGIAAAKKIVKHATAVDAVEVVRCKDCMHYKQNPYSVEEDMWCMCWSDWVPAEPQAFCSYGERKDNETD